MAKAKEFWSVEEAIAQAKAIGIEVSAPTIYKWIDVFDLGHQPGGKGGKRYVYPKKFMNFITGKPYVEKNQNQDCIGSCPNEK